MQRRGSGGAAGLLHPPLPVKLRTCFSRDGRDRQKPSVRAGYPTLRPDMQSFAGFGVTPQPRPRYKLDPSAGARAVSSAGRAPRLHRGCRQFDPVTAHHASPLRATRGAATRRPLGRSSARRSLSDTKAKTGEAGNRVVRFILRSTIAPEQEYVGATGDLKQRIADHNNGKSRHTTKYRPWNLVWYSAFPDKYKALAFENYLKSHSGRAFARKRLI